MKSIKVLRTGGDDERLVYTIVGTYDIEETGYTFGIVDTTSNSILISFSKEHYRVEVKDEDRTLDNIKYYDEKMVRLEKIANTMLNHLRTYELTDEELQYVLTLVMLGLGWTEEW